MSRSKALLAAGIAQLAAFAFVVTTGAQAQTQPKGSAAPPAVVVAPVKNETITQHASFVGNVDAIQLTNIQARVEGYIEKVAFTEGSMVKTGDLLFSLDKGTYQAALESAQASLLQAQAQEAGAKAKLTDADLTLERQKTLLKSNTVAQAVVDQAQAARDEAAAGVQQAEAQIASAQASIDNAQLNLSYTDIIAPIDGRIGKADFTKGNLVNTASGTLATVIQMDPIRVVFSIADRDYVDVVERFKLTPTTDVESRFVPQIVLPNGETYDKKGKITFIDNQVDQQTGTIAVYANFPNPDSVLVSGQFVNVTVDIGQPQDLPVIPAGAVLQDKEGPYVLVVDSDNRAQIQRIETAQKTASGWAVSKGLTQGQTIIVDGIQKVTPGMVVSPQTAKAAS